MISSLAHKIFKDRKCKEPARCFECGISIKIFSNRGFLSIDRAINHVFVHFGKKLFSCLHCDKQFALNSCIKKHLKCSHGLNGNPSNYADSTGKYRQEICDLLIRCFEQKQSTIAGHLEGQQNCNAVGVSCW